jgi:MFS family permease
MNRSLLWLGAALFTWGIGEGMFLIFQPIYLQQLGADPIQIGTILGAFGLVMTAAHIPAGHLSDRIGRRPMLVTAWLVGIGATILMALAKSLPTFIVGILLYGFTAFVVSPLDSYVTAARGHWSVARAITFISMTFNAGGLLGPATGGWIGDHYGLRTVYFVSTGIFILSTVIIFFIASQPRDRHDPADPPPGLFTNRRYLGFLSVFFVVALATYLPQPLTPNFLNNQRGLSLSMIGLLGSIGSLGNAGLNYLLGQFEARSGFVLGQIGTAAFAVLIWRGTGLPWFALGYFLLGGSNALRGLGVAMVRPFVHESQMGLAYGIAQTLSSATVLIAPPLAGYLYSLDPVLMYTVGLVLMAIGLVVSLVFVPRSARLPPDPIELAHDL